MRIPLPTSPPSIPLPAGHWPSRVGTAELLLEVERLHSNAVDFEKGDLIDRLRGFDCYHLQALALDTLDADEWACNEDTAREYAEAPGAFPPIVYDPREGSIIDGTHRVNAAILRGETHIWAYVGEIPAGT